MDKLTGTIFEKAHFQKAFRTLKPACDAFITEPNDVNSKLLKNALEMVPEYALTQLQPYVLIPLEIHLKANKCVDCTCMILHLYQHNDHLQVCFLDQIVL